MTHKGNISIEEYSITPKSNKDADHVIGKFEFTGNDKMFTIRNGKLKFIDTEFQCDNTLFTKLLTLLSNHCDGYIEWQDDNGRFHKGDFNSGNVVVMDSETVYRTSVLDEFIETYKDRLPDDLKEKIIAFKVAEKI